MSDIAQFRTTRPHMLKASKEYASQTLMGGLSGFESPIGLDRRDRIHALKSGDIGFVHSWDINTSVDGPGNDRVHERMPSALPVLPESRHVEDARRAARIPRRHDQEG